MRSLYFILSVFAVNSLSAQEAAMFKKEQFASGKDVLNYRILYPTRYDVNKKYPLVIFLHGIGERGSDNEKQLTHGGKLFLDSANRAAYPAFVIFPQCPEDGLWANISREKGKDDSLGPFQLISSPKPMKPLDLVMQLIDSFDRTPQADQQQIYIGGLSMGAMGTYELLWRKPDFFAAAIAICGAGDADKVKTYAKNFPLWAFHGDKDPAVLVTNSRLMVNTLKGEGAKVKYTEYPGVAHDSWNNAFAEPGLLKWLFSQKK